MVRRFHEVAVAHGGQDNGGRPARATTLLGTTQFVLDPDGNNIEAVYHGHAQRSAPSVMLTF